MQATAFTRRFLMLGALSGLGGCGAISALNSAASVLDTYDLSPAPGAQAGPRTARTLLVARPEATAAIDSDRIMVKPDAVSITYLPDARWTDDLPLVFQSLLIRSISGTGRIGYVGRSDGGPVPDRALLVRMDAFNVTVLANGAFGVAVDVTITVLNDGTQRVIGSRRFSQSAEVPGETPGEIVSAFQDVLNVLLPAMSDWTLQRV